ncbi:putative ABC transport system ATP-binding protein [Jiangella alba]|uniref:Putative ABC transport system ATP-binding protein n=2 Tax=Jiangella alba TaxID=561176 RepID=A0A1H5PAM2_9ACTN|nr:putative ABC transport system ATP-binding protein [Jiangella alba]
MHTMTAPAVRLDAVTKIYGSGEQRVTALHEVGVDLAVGTFTAVMGPSGSGKSTFLHCAAGLDRPTSGSVRLADTELSTLSDNELTVVRRDRIGFVFQAYNLLSSLTVEDNVSLPLRLAGREIDPGWIARVAGSVGLGDHLQRRPAQLSGGQQQRVAIARALVTQPDAVFADEPTGALDTRTGRQVLELLRRIVDDSGQTVVMVTHDPVAASFADRVLFLADGRVTGVMDAPTAELVAERMTKLGAW